MLGQLRYACVGSLDQTTEALCAAARPESEFEMTAVLSRGASFASYSNLLGNPALEAIYLGMTPTRAFPYVRAAVDAGLHVLCEAMPSASAADWDALALAAAAQPKPPYFGCRSLLEPAHRAARSLGCSGKLGELRSFSAVWCARETDTDSLVLECLRHARDFFQEEPTEVLAASRSVTSCATSVVVKFRSDRLGVLACGFDAQPSFRYDLSASCGELRLLSAPTESSADEVAATIAGVSLETRFPHAGGFGFAVDQFTRDVRTARVPSSLAREAHANARMLEAIECASREERSVRLKKPPQFLRDLSRKAKALSRGSRGGRLLSGWGEPLTTPKAFPDPGRAATKRPAITQPRSG